MRIPLEQNVIYVESGIDIDSTGMAFRFGLVGKGAKKPLAAISGCPTRVDAVDDIPKTMVWL